ncbi:GAF domain-containing protein [soil metagenome]
MAPPCAYILPMFTFLPADSADKPRLYADLIAAARAITEGEPDGIANMANVAALIGQYLPALTWAGFYRLVGDELVLGPFQGKPACIRIPIGRGVCGAAVAGRQTVRVENVHAFPGHIACDAASASEIVVPIISGGRLIGVRDLDSPVTARFDARDQEGLEGLIAALADALG